MKKKLCLYLIAAFSTLAAYTQQVRVSGSYDGLILSLSRLSENGSTVESKLRFTCWLHLGTHVHLEFNKNAGIFTGLGIKNVGLISTNTSGLIEIKRKHRSYNLYLPLGLKFGDFDKRIAFFFGGTIELPFHYKEKYFEDDDKKYKFTEWFSQRTPLFMYAAFAGFEFPAGIYIKFHYYFNDFLNKDFEKDGTKIYKDLNSKVFYISMGMNLYNRKYYGVSPIRKFLPAKKETTAQFL